MPKTLDIITSVISENWSLESEYVHVREAFGRILSHDIRSNSNVPSYRTSTAHGYAIIVNDEKSKKKILDPRTTVSYNKCSICIIN